MKKSILFLSDIGCQKRDYERFGIKILKDKFNVHFLDCTKWLQPDFYKRKTEHNYSFHERIVVRNFNHLKELIFNQKKKKLNWYN